MVVEFTPPGKQILKHVEMNDVNVLFIINNLLVVLITLCILFKLISREILMWYFCLYYSSGSPVWKPRELGESSTLPRKKKSNQEQFETRTMVRKGEKKNKK